MKPTKVSGIRGGDCKSSDTGTSGRDQFIREQRLASTGGGFSSAYLCIYDIPYSRPIRPKKQELVPHVTKEYRDVMKQFGGMIEKRYLVPV